MVGRRVEAGPDEASLRGARSEDIVVLLPVELNGVAMVIPVPGWLMVRSSTPSAPAMANGPSGGAVWEPARTVFPLPKPVNATLPPICCRMFAVGSGTLAAMAMLSSPKMLVALLRTPIAAKAVSVAEDIQHTVGKALCLNVAEVAKIHREVEVGGGPPGAMSPATTAARSWGRG